MTRELLPLDLVLAALDAGAGREFAARGRVQLRAVLIASNGSPVKDLPLHWGSEQDLAAELGRLRFHLAEMKSGRFGVLGEAWLKPDDGTPLAPSKSDRRIEVVWVLAGDEGGEPLFGYREIRRDAIGAELGPFIRDGAVAGALADIFK